MSGAADATPPPQSRLLYSKDAAGKEILVMVTPGKEQEGEEEEEEEAAVQNQRAAIESFGSASTSSDAASPFATEVATVAVAAAAAAARPYQGTNTIVMMEWEKEYMETLVEALAIHEDDEVLEIGWGLGYSATAIQQRRPRQHVIVECDPGVTTRAEAWKQTLLKEDEEEEKEEAEAAGSSDNNKSSISSRSKNSSCSNNSNSNKTSRSSGRRSIVLVQGYWQQVLASLGQFTAVLMDDFPLPLKGLGADDEARVLASTGGSRWHHFLDLIVSFHLYPGGRVTGYLSRDLELGRCDCSYTRRPTQVMVPPNCTYATPGLQTYFVPLVKRNMMGGGEGEGKGGRGGVGAVGCTHFITGRGRGESEITTQDKREGQGGMMAFDDDTIAQKRQRMIDYVLAAQGQERTRWKSC